jgi:hypothetical protein
MAYVAPQASEMFSDAVSKAEVAERFEAYKDALNQSAASAKGNSFLPEKGIVKTGSANALSERMDMLTKSVGVDVTDSVRSELDALKVLVGDINKEWSITTPLSTGLVPYDLEAPAKLLVPRLTPLRNSLTRTKGQGTARKFKRILGWSNSGVGGVADKSPFINSTSISTAFGPVNLRRGSMISYAADEKSVSYVEMGMSDIVDWQAQFAGQGFQDIRQLSQTALLWSHFGGEERAMLFGRGSAGNGYKGAVSAPVITSSTATTGGTIAAGTYLATITARTGFGESVISNEQSQVTTGATSTITYTVSTEPIGALGYNLYMTLVGGASGTEKFQVSFVGNSVTVTAPPASTGAAQPGSDTSADANAYDGFLTVLSDPTQSGYVKRVNAALSTANPGDEFQQALLSLYQSVKADPEEIWVDSGVMKEAGDLFKTASSSNYRIDLDGGNIAGGYKLGAAVTGLVNQVTSRMVDLKVHPYMPAGAAIVRSRTLPVPDSQVSETSQVVNVQDYMSVDWPVIQYTYDQSTYQYGTLVHYAPAWSGSILGLK